jgi:hypothetical protein
MECELSQWAKENAKCCQCEGTLKNDKHINLVTTSKIATWKYPASGNVFIPKAPNNAMAIICDKCADSGNIKPVFAIECNFTDAQITYHKIESLEDEPEWVRQAKEKLSRPNPVFN